MNMTGPHALIRQCLVLGIRLYQTSLSILLGPCCRFFPSCSAYTALSIQRFGVAKGARLAFRRVCKCHPLNPGGYDPVPDCNQIP